MLYSQHAQLHAATKQQSYRLVKEQIAYYENNFRIIATQASVLAGFSFSLLGTELDTDKIGVVAQLIFVTFTALAIAFNVMAVATSTLCGIMAPRLALLGPDGSVQRAVKGMHYEHKWTYRSNMVGRCPYYYVSTQSLLTCRRACSFSSCLQSRLAGVRRTPAKIVGVR